MKLEIVGVNIGDTNVPYIIIVFIKDKDPRPTNGSLK